MTTICASRLVVGLARTSNQFCDKLLNPNGLFGRQEALNAFLSSIIAASGASLVPSPDTAIRKIVGVGVVLATTETSANFLSEQDVDHKTIRNLAKQYLQEGLTLNKETVTEIRKMQDQLKKFILALDSLQFDRLDAVLEDDPFSECKKEEALLKKLLSTLVIDEKQRNLLDATSVIFSAKEQEMKGLLLLSRFFAVEGRWDVFEESLKLTTEQTKILDVFKGMLRKGNNKDVVYLLAESYLQSDMCSKTSTFLDNKINAQRTIFFAMPLYSLFGIFRNFHFLFTVFHYASLFTAMAATAHLAYQHFFSKIPEEIRADAIQLKDLNKLI